MSSSKPRSSFHMSVPGWRAWAGLVVGPVAWGIHHQLGSNLSYAACDRGPDTISLIVGLVALAAIGLTGWLGWRSWKHAGGMKVEEADALDVFIPLLSITAATMFALPILVQMFADIIVPSCFA